MSKKKRIVRDERDAKNQAVASEWALWITVIYTFGKLIYYLSFSAVEDLGFIMWDMILIVIITLTLIIITYSRKTYDLPRTFFGKKLLTEQSKQAKKERLLKAYLPEALILAVAMTIGSYFLSGYNSITEWLFELILYFIIFNLFNFAWGELNVKGYNKSLEE